MQTKVLLESGYEQSALGFSLSYNSTIHRAKEIFPKFAFGKPGENKFLESIVLWIDVTAPIFWWQEADTYRLSTKQSASKMHTFHKREVNNDDFLYPIPEIYLSFINLNIKSYINQEITVDELMTYIPAGYLQRRIWCMSYKTLQNIYIQRHDHKLNEWRIFVSNVIEQIEHPEFIVNK